MNFGIVISIALERYKKTTLDVSTKLYNISKY